MKLGSTTISDLKIGSAAVSKAYLGSNLVWMPAGGFTDPTSLGVKLIAWLDMTDTTTMWQDTARTTAATAISNPVRYIDDKSANGNDFSATHSTDTGNGLVIAGGMDVNNSALRIDGTAVGFTTSMEVFSLVNYKADNSFILLGNAASAGYGIGIGQNGSGAAANTQAGVTNLVNNVDLGSTTRNTLHDTIAAYGSVFVNHHALNVDMTGLTTNALMLAFTTLTFRTAGDARHFVLTTALTSTERADLNTWLLAQG